MVFEKLFYSTSLWALFFLTIALVLISVEAGIRYGRFSNKRRKIANETPIGAIVGAMLGLLSFIMAFSFGMANSYYEARRTEILRESNAIGTAYLRTSFIPEPGRGQMRGLLREYVNIRVEGVKAGNIGQTIDRSENLLDDLWEQASVITSNMPATPLTGLFIESLNDVIDIHSDRIMAGLHKHIPWIIWVALYFVMIFSMIAVGYQFGIDGVRSVLGTVALALTFSAVMVLIADLDNPARGIMKTTQWSMNALQSRLNAEADLSQKN